MKASSLTKRKAVPRLGRARSGKAVAVSESSTVEALYDCEVVGHHLADPDHLLVLGGDGQLYALDIHSGHTTPTDLSDQWLIDTCPVRNMGRRSPVA